MSSLKAMAWSAILALSVTAWGATEFPAKVTGKRANIFVITLQVNGKDRHFVVDTGCSISVLGRDAFRDSLVLDTSESVTLFSSRVHPEMIHVDLTIAGKRISENVFRTDLSGINEALGIAIDGVIGQDILSHFTTVTLNFKTHRLILE